MKPSNATGVEIRRRALLAVFLMSLVMVSGCAVRPVGLVYTHMKLPLTTNLNETPVPGSDPPSGRVLEIKEPISGAGIYAKIDSNAIGDIARKNGMQTLYFADQEIFSILGIWSTYRTLLYGE